MEESTRRSEALFIQVSSGGGMSSSGPEKKESRLATVLLAPFSPVPSLDFGSVRLGKSAIGILHCANPGTKTLLVSIDKFPKEEKGLSIDFRGPFEVPGHEMAVLSIGWVPVAGGAFRENVSIKYGSFKTSFTLCGLCQDPLTEKMRKMPSFKRPALKNLPQNKQKAPLPPNPISENTLRTSPPKQKYFPSPADIPSSGTKAKKELISWSPQPVHFMDGSFLKKGEESKLQEVEPAPLPSWTGSSTKRENNWTPVDENFIRNRQGILHVSNNESLLPPCGEETSSLLRSLPLDKGGDLKRRDTYASQKTFRPISASCPKEGMFILDQIESVKAKLEDSGIPKCYSPLQAVFKNSTDVLNDIQTNLVCSPVRTSDIIEKLQLSDINVCLDISPHKNNYEEEVEEPLSKKISGIDLSFKLDLDLSLSPKKSLKEEALKNLDLSIDVNLDLSPPIGDSPKEASTQQVESEPCKVNTSMEQESSKSQELDEISLLVAEHLSMNDQKHDKSLPTNKPILNKQPLPKLPPNRPMDEISLLVAEHLNNQDELRKKLHHNLLLQSLDDTKKYEYKEDTIYETNLHECKESFLQTTINETSFVPIPEKGYCSTAVKDKSRELSSIHQLSEERSSAFCRDLFGSKSNNSNASIHFANDSHLGDVPKPSLKTDSPPQISSDTYILSPETKKLSTINEVNESSRPNSVSKHNLVSKPNSFSISLSPQKSVFKAPLTDDLWKRSQRSVREKPLRPRLFSASAASSTSKGSPHKKGSPYKRRSLAPKSVKPGSKSGLTLIKMAAASNPKLTTNTKIARHPNLFSAKNLYYDERWIEKQKKGFAKWLNFILTPSECEDDLSSNSKKTDGAKLWSACAKDVKVPRAPTKEVMSFRAYTMGKEMNTLRLSAIRLWQSPEVVRVIRQLEIEIEKKRLYVRDDRCINKDLGIKQSFLSILLNYNTLWLRIGLETIYGEVLQISGNSDIVGIGRFIITRLLSNPDILDMFSHPTVPHLYKPGHEEALKKFTLKMFLRLIFFLDVAKNQKLIKHDPCLFCKDADFKMSRDLLVEFSKKFLACEGDITKHLRSIGYDVTHRQSTLDEFDYAIVNFPADLRCGVRLCRVMESLLSGGEYTSKVRLPAHSRLQKVHNVSIALEALKQSPAGLPKGMDAKDIVNGQVEKCLGLIWHIIYGLGTVDLLPESKWRKEIDGLRSSLKTIATVHELATSGLSFVEEKETHSPPKEESTSSYVLTWARLVCAHYGIEIENLTVSFSDGRALCFLIHHYYPSLLTQEEIMMNTTVSSIACSDVTTSIGDNKKANEELLNNEKKNFKTCLDKVNELGGVPILIRYSDMSNTIPDRKVTMTFLIYLASRLLHLREEVTAAIKIQSAWRRLQRSREKKYLKEKYSTTDLSK